MQTVDRLGVHIDQCTGCRGIFLDRGELEQISAAEQNHYGPAAAPPPYQPDAGHRPPMGGVPRGGYADSPGGYRGGYGDSPKGYRGGYADSPKGYGHGGHGGHRKKRRSFLEDLFD